MARTPDAPERERYCRGHKIRLPADAFAPFVQYCLECNTTRMTCPRCRTRRPCAEFDPKLGGHPRRCASCQRATLRKRALTKHVHNKSSAKRRPCLRCGERNERTAARWATCNRCANLNADAASAAEGYAV